MAVEADGLEDPDHLRVQELLVQREVLAGSLLEKLQANDGQLDLATRFGLAKKAFAHTAAYDSNIAKYLGDAPDEAMAGCYKLGEAS